MAAPTANGTPTRSIVRKDVRVDNGASGSGCDGFESTLKSAQTLDSKIAAKFLNQNVLLIVKRSGNGLYNSKRFTYSGYGWETC